jgi:hypothetical protein
MTRRTTRCCGWLVAGAAAAALAVPSAQASPLSRAAGWLGQQQDGAGCVGEWHQTAWAAIAFRAAGAGTAATNAGYCVAPQLGSIASATDRELAILGLVAGAINPRRIAGHDLVRELLHQRRGGYFGAAGLTNSDVFGILALRAARVTPPAVVVRQVLSDQSRSGGWDFRPGGVQADMTAAAIEALRADGWGCRSTRIQRGFAVLHRLRHRDGGFGLLPGDPSNTQSTSWVAQAYAACGISDRRGVRFLAAHQQASGAITYGASSVSPTWPTTQAIPALAGRALPVR